MATDAGNHTAAFNGSYNFCNQQVYATNGVLLPAASYAQVPETYLSGATCKTSSYAPDLRQDIAQHYDDYMQQSCTASCCMHSIALHRLRSDREVESQILRSSVRPSLLRRPHQWPHQRLRQPQVRLACVWGYR